MKILYFSSTGNCLYVAKKIGGELLSIPKSVRNHINIFSDDIVGIVIPVYWLSVPAYVRNFLSQAIFQCSYFFGIMTYGDNIFGALNDLNTITTANGRKFDYLTAIKMTNNYLPMYEMTKEIEKTKKYHVEEKLQVIYDNIKIQTHYIPNIGWFSKWLSKIHMHKHCMTLGEGEAAKMNVSEECVACGQCVKICPTRNITLSGQTITFGKQCTDCLGCIHNCPQNCIHIKGEKSNIRYRNPNISAKELTEVSRHRTEI